MISTKAYLAIEDSLGAKLLEAYKKATGSLFKEVESLINAGEYEQALEAVQSFSLHDVEEELAPYIEYITNLSLLFGASRVTSKPGTSVVGLGFKKNTAYQASSLFKQTISVNAVEQLKKQAVQLIAQHREKNTTVQKADALLPFASFMDDAGRAYFNLVSSLHTSRLSAYGFTAEADALGLEEYRINEQLDARTCPVCRQMHGKIFRVSDARNLLDIVVRVTDPDALKQLQPWPKQDKETLGRLSTMTTSELVSEGWHIPPFHPRCRGLLARVNKVPSLAAIDSGNTDERTHSTKADFLMLGIEATDKQVSKWNDLVNLPPDMLLSTLLKQPVVDMLKSIFDKKTVVKVSMYEKYAKLKVAGSYYGLDKISAELKVYEDALSISSGSIFPSVNEFMQYVKAAYVTASDAGLSELRILRSTATYDLAPKGFVVKGAYWVLDLGNAGSVKKFLS